MPDAARAHAARRARSPRREMRAVAPASPRRVAAAARSVSAAREANARARAAVRPSVVAAAGAAFRSVTAASRRPRPHPPEGPDEGATRSISGLAPAAPRRRRRRRPARPPTRPVPSPRSSAIRSRSAESRADRRRGDVRALRRLARRRRRTRRAVVEWRSSRDGRGDPPSAASHRVNDHVPLPMRDMGRGVADTDATMLSAPSIGSSRRYAVAVGKIARARRRARTSRRRARRTPPSAARTSCVGSAPLLAGWCASRPRRTASGLSDRRSARPRRAPRPTVRTAGLGRTASGRDPPSRVAPRAEHVASTLRRSPQLVHRARRRRPIGGSAARRQEARRGSTTDSRRPRERRALLCRRALGPTREGMSVGRRRKRPPAPGTTLTGVSPIRSEAAGGRRRAGRLVVAARAPSAAIDSTFGHTADGRASARGGRGKAREARRGVGAAVLEGASNVYAGSRAGGSEGRAPRRVRERAGAKSRVMCPPVECRRAHSRIDKLVRSYKGSARTNGDETTAAAAAARRRRTEEDCEPASRR